MGRNIEYRQQSGDRTLSYTGDTMVMQRAVLEMGVNAQRRGDAMAWGVCIK